jgi:hypothetical protein
MGISLFHRRTIIPILMVLAGVVVITFPYYNNVNASTTLANSANESGYGTTTTHITLEGGSDKTVPISHSVHSSQSSSTSHTSSSTPTSSPSSKWSVSERDVGAALDSGLLSHRPMILLPGFASSRLRVWQSVTCPGSALQFRAGDAVWLNIAMVVGARSCWLVSIYRHSTHCMYHFDC